MNECSHKTGMWGLNLLTSGWFLWGLALLILNDHYLKSAYPSYLTGKLSDFAGLFVMAAFMWALTPPRLVCRRLLVCLHVTIGVAFIVWKIAPVEIPLVYLSQLTGLPMPSRVKDATDLMALSILPFCYLFLLRHSNATGKTACLTAMRKCASVFILCLSGWAIMATSQPTNPAVECCEGLRGNVDGDNAGLITVYDIAFLEDFLYHGGPRPECLIEADVDGSCDKNPVTEDDLTYLIDYVLSDGPEPYQCFDCR